MGDDRQLGSKRKPRPQPVRQPSTPGDVDLFQHLYDQLGNRRFSQLLSARQRRVPYQSEMEQAFGEGFGDVRTVFGPGAAELNDAMGARAVTLGDQIAFADEAPPKDLVAHELAHVVQQRGSSHVQSPQLGPGTADAEDEAEAAALAVLAGRRVPALSHVQPQLAWDQADPEVASMETPAGGDATAEMWVIANAKMLSTYLIAKLHQATFTTPLASMELSNEFSGVVLKRLDYQSSNPLALWALVEKELAPDSLTDLVNHGRDCYPNLLGTFAFKMGVIDEVSRAYARRLVESLKRIGPRWARVQNQLAYRAETFDVTALRPPALSEVVASHPIDVAVIQALGETAKLDVDAYRRANIGETIALPIDTAVALSLADFEFVDVDDGGDTGLVRLLRHRTASREDVARALTDSEQNAWQIEAMGPLFRVPPDLFTPAVRAAWELARGPLPGLGTLTEISRDELALASSHDVVPTEELGDEANGRRIIVERIAQVVRHLTELAVLSAGDADTTRGLNELVATLQARGKALRDGPPADALRWDPQTQGQADIVLRALSGAQQAVFVGRAVADWPRSQAIVGRMVGNFTAAALKSDTVSVGYDALAFADTQLGQLQVDLLDLMLADMRQALTEAAPERGNAPPNFLSYAVHPEGDWGPYLPKAVGRQFARDEERLRAKVAAIRVAVLQDPVAAAPLVAKLASEVAQLGTGVALVHDFDQMDQVWQQLAESTNRLAGGISGTTWTKVWKMNDLTKLADVWRGVYATWKRDKAEGEKALVAARPQLTKLMGEIKDAVEEANAIDKWVDFALMIGIMFASAGVGGFVEAAVGGGTLGGFAAGTVAEYATFTLLSNALFSTEHSFGALLHEFGDNAMMFSALKTISMVYVGIVGEAATKTLKGKFGGLLIQFTALNSKALYDASQAQRAQTGHGLSGAQIAEISLENIAFLAASELGGKLIEPGMEVLRTSGRQLNSIRQLAKAKDALAKSAAQIAAAKVTHEKLQAMLEEQRAYLALRDAAIAELEGLGEKGRAEVGLDEAQYKRLKGEHAEARTAFARVAMFASLEPAGPNAMYCRSEHFAAAAQYYANQPGTKVRLYGADPLTGAVSIEVIPPDFVPPEGGAPQPGTPFRIIERLSKGTAPIARTPELSAITPANIALRTDVVVAVQTEDRPTYAETAHFAEWLTEAPLHADPRLAELYRKRLRDYYASDPMGALQVAARYGYGGVSAGEAAPIPEGATATAVPRSDAERAFAHYQAGRAGETSSRAGDELLTATDFEAMYSSGFRYDPVTEEWFGRGDVKPAGGAPAGGVAGTQAIGEVSSEATGLRVLRLLAGGQSNGALAAGVEPAAACDPRLNEWGLGLRDDGKYVIVRAPAGDLDWAAVPGVEPIAHSRPSVERYPSAEQRVGGAVRGPEIYPLADTPLPAADALNIMEINILGDYLRPEPRSEGRGGVYEGTTLTATPGAPAGAMQYTLRVPSSAGVQEVLVKIELVPESALGPGAHAERSGHARLLMENRGGRWEAHIRVHERVSEEGLTEILRHELDEISIIMRRLAEARPTDSPRFLEQQHGSSLFRADSIFIRPDPPGRILDSLPGHDHAAGREVMRLHSRARFHDPAARTAETLRLDAALEEMGFGRELNHAERMEALRELGASKEMLDYAQAYNVRTQEALRAGGGGAAPVGIARGPDIVLIDRYTAAVNDWVEGRNRPANEQIMNDIERVAAAGHLRPLIQPADLAREGYENSLPEVPAGGSTREYRNLYGLLESMFRVRRHLQGRAPFGAGDPLQTPRLGERPRLPGTGALFEASRFFPSDVANQPWSEIVNRYRALSGRADLPNPAVSGGSARSGKTEGQLRLTWTFADGSRIHVDFPYQPSSPFEANRRVHLQREIPLGNNVFVPVSASGVVVPYASSPAHAVIIPDADLVDLARRGRSKEGL